MIQEVVLTPAQSWNEVENVSVIPLSSYPGLTARLPRLQVPREGGIRRDSQPVRLAPLFVTKQPSNKP